MDAKELMYEIEVAYNELSNLVWEYRTQAMLVRSMDYDLEGSKLALYRDGKVEGKNQTERDACIAELLEGDIGKVEYAKQEEAELYMKMELAKLKVEKWRAVLRVLELSEVDNGRIL